MTKPIVPVQPEEASEKNKMLFDRINRKAGRVPNMYKVMGNSSAVLDSYLGLSNGLLAGTIGPKLAEMIAIATAEFNGCAYCLSAHTFYGEKVGLSPEEIEATREFKSTDSKLNAALAFNKILLENPRELRQENIEPLREVGFSDGEILEIIGNVVRNMFTNYINTVSATDVDWPVVVKPHDLNAHTV